MDAVGTRISTSTFLGQSPTILCQTQAPLSMEFSRQVDWSGLPCPPPGALLDPGIKPESPASPALQVEQPPAGLSPFKAWFCCTELPLCFREPYSSVKNLPAMQETQVWFLGQEDPLKKQMATSSSILTWRIPWTEKPGGYSPWNSKSWTFLT